MAQRVNCLPPRRETWVQSLGWEDPRRRKWQHTPVSLSGEFHGWRSLVGYSPWGHKELDRTEWLTHICLLSMFYLFIVFMGFSRQKYWSDFPFLSPVAHVLSERWASKNWCFWTVLLEKTLVRPLECKEIQPVHPKGNQFWTFTGRTDAEAESPILWPPDVKNGLI